MIELPSRPGYFWDVATQKLYSKKRTKLRELTLSQPNSFTVLDEPYYSVWNGKASERISISAIKRAVAEKPAEKKAREPVTLDDLW